MSQNTAEIASLTSASTLACYLASSMMTIGFGCALLCAYSAYLLHDPNRSQPIIRYALISVTILLAIQVAITFGDLLYVFAFGFGNQERVAGYSRSFVAAEIVTAFVIAQVQAFYTWRIYIITRRRIFAFGFGILILLFVMSHIARSMIGLYVNQADNWSHHWFLTAQGIVCAFARLPCSTDC